MTTATAPRGEIKGWHVLVVILGFFGVIIGVNATFMVYAFRSFPGEDVPRSYLQGLHYNDTIAARRAQAARGWRDDVALEQDRIVVSLTDRDGTPLSHMTLEGALRRPLDARGDVVLRFAPIGDGRYAAAATLTPGAWELRATARRDQDVYEIDQRLEWPSPK